MVSPTKDMPLASIDFNLRVPQALVHLPHFDLIVITGIRTWWQTLLELLSLVAVLEDKRVDESLAPDLELDVVGVLVLLYAGGYKSISIQSNISILTLIPSPQSPINCAIAATPDEALRSKPLCCDRNR